MPADFEPGATGLTTVITGLVQPTLDADGKPVFTGTVATATSPARRRSPQWYRDTPGVNHTTAGTLTLWNNGNGAYVNR